MVKPETLIRWHRKGFRLFWRCKSCGRPRLPANLRRLIARMASDNPTWGEERIAAELLLKLGISVSLGPSGATCPLHVHLDLDLGRKSGTRGTRLSAIT